MTLASLLAGALRLVVIKGNPTTESRVLIARAKSRVIIRDICQSTAERFSNIAQYPRRKWTGI